MISKEDKTNTRDGVNLNLESGYGSASVGDVSAALVKSWCGIELRVEAFALCFKKGGKILSVFLNKEDAEKVLGREALKDGHEIRKVVVTASLNGVIMKADRQKLGTLIMYPSLENVLNLYGFLKGVGFLLMLGYVKIVYAIDYLVLI